MKNWIFAGMVLMVCVPSHAQADGTPKNWAFGMQDPVTPVGQQIQDFHNLLLVIIFAISALVIGLLGYIFVRFRASRNKTPSKFAHNTTLEIVWTAIPILIVFVIIVYSLKLLYMQNTIPEAEMTVKAIGKQWYWTYEYPDMEEVVFDSYMLTKEEAQQAGKPHLLGTNNPLVIPEDTTIRLLITAGDVLHSFAVPSFGIKTDAVPGRLNENWVHVQEPGVYYGQCSELCGKDHAYMPIEIHVLSKEDYRTWVEDARQEFGALVPQDDGERQKALAALGQ